MTSSSSVSRRSLACAMASLGLLAGAQSARASLDVNYQFNGKGNWSLDAVGGNSSPVGVLEAFVPVGSKIEKAFLYSSITPNGSLTSVTFDGTLLSVGDFTNLGSNSIGLTAYRADVTTQVSAKIGGGSAARFSFNIDNENPSGGIDGEALAIIYSNPNEKTRTIAFLDGFSQSAGDSFTVNLGSPLVNPASPGFEAQFSLGIGFGFQGGDQSSLVTVNGQRLTSSAGGQDDGASSNGGLITIGGLDDDPSNPANPFGGPNGNPRLDDELYDLASGGFLSTGITSFNVATSNPSNDDNIFFAGLNITAVAGVDQPPPPPPDGMSAVPEPSTYGLIGAGLLAGVVALRRRRAAKSA